jgi:leader peptidase (prepilin peptidase)/N-methyltransferase
MAVNWADLYVLGALLAAPFFGSLAGSLALRLPAAENVVMARSICPQCRAKLRWHELIPLVSWLAARGRCRHCGAAIGAFYPAIELAALVVALSAVLAFAGVELLLACGLGWTLLALGLADWRSLILPDALTLPLAAAGLAAVWALYPDSLFDHVIGAVAGFALFLAIAQGYRYWRGREGLGMGDAKLMAAGGAWLGWNGLPSVIVIGAVLALIAAVLEHGRQGLGRDTRIAFGTWLAVAIWIVFLLGPLVVT